jgi:hypothetical protein
MCEESFSADIMGSVIKPMIVIGLPWGLTCGSVIVRGENGDEMFPAIFLVRKRVKKFLYWFIASVLKTKWVEV